MKIGDRFPGSGRRLLLLGFLFVVLMATAQAKDDWDPTGPGGPRNGYEETQPAPSASETKPYPSASPFAKPSPASIAYPPQKGAPTPVPSAMPPEPVPTADATSNPSPLPPVPVPTVDASTSPPDQDVEPLPPQTDTVPAPQPPLSYDAVPTDWSVSGQGPPHIAPTVPKEEPATPAEYLLALLQPRQAEPHLLTLALPRYSYFQGFVYAAGSAVIAGPVRVLGGVFAGGGGRTSWLLDGAMLTTTPDYLRPPAAPVRSRFRIVEWREVP